MSTNIMDGPWNITSFLSVDAVEDPVTATHRFLNLLGEFALPLLLIIIGVVLWTLMRRVPSVSDWEAASYSGFIMTLTGLLLFFVVTGDGEKLLSWPQYLIILVITAIVIGMHKMMQQY